MGALARSSSLLRRRFARTRSRLALLWRISQRTRTKRFLFATSIVSTVFLYACTLSYRWCPTATPASSTIVASTSARREPLSGNDPFQVIVLTHSRKDSLLRLLSSVNDADYGGDFADLRIWIDRSVPEQKWLQSLLRLWWPLHHFHTVDADTVREASQFTWSHGEKTVHVWDRHVGIWGQWLDTYRPSGTNPEEFGVLLEDDLEVSPMYYKWLKQAKAAYGHRQDIFGYTLQRGTLRANQTGFGRRPLHIRDREKAYLYLLVGSWGYAPEAKSWAQFREWFHVKSCAQGYHPYVHGLIPTKWYIKQERKRSMWTMWHIKFADLFKLHTVYANLGGHRTLASNWREPGLHFRKSANKKKASSVTGRKDFSLLEKAHGSDGAGLFEFPKDPRVVSWNGTYVDRNGIRTTH